jgi:TRAP-type C4-dicarboxylate transport system substrate-binding protein
MVKNRLYKKMIVSCLIILTGMLLSMPAFAKVIEITVSDHNPPVAPPAQALVAWANKVNELCAGKVKLTVHGGGSILKGNEAYRGVQKGIVDVAHYVLDNRDGFYLNTVMTLPFMGWPGQIETGMIYQELMKKFPKMRAEWKGVMPYGFCMMPPTQIHNDKKVIRTPADMKGMKFHGAETALVKTIDAAGATAVQLDIADMYMSLDRGLIDGVINHFPVLAVFGVLKLLDYHTILGDGGINMTPMGIIWNQDSWNKLPPDVQKTILDAQKYYRDPFYAGDLGFQKKVIGDAKAMNQTFTYLTPSEIKLWYDLVKKPIHDEWVEAAEAKGLPGRAVYEETLKMLKK